MSVNKLKPKDWTKDKRKWIFQTRYTDLNGKTKKYKSKRYLTKKEAQEAERIFFLELDRYRPDNNMTFKELYLSFFEYQKNRVKQNTINTYTSRSKYIALLYNVKVKEFNLQYYEMWRKKILENKQLANSTRNYIYKFLKTLMNFGSRWYNINFNHIYPKMTNFTDPNERKEEMKFWTYEDFKTFISLEEKLPYKTFYKTLYYCGLRKNEARALNWKDIDFINNTLNVNKGLVKHNGKHNIISPKTLSSNRTLPLTNELKKDLLDLKKYYQTNANFNEDWFVFGAEKPLDENSIRRRKNKNCQLAGVQQIRIHDFRHSCASLLINNGADITLVAKYLGHSKANETLNTYSHMFENKLDNLVQTINNLDNNF